MSAILSGFTLLSVFFSAILSGFTLLSAFLSAQKSKTTQKRALKSKYALLSAQKRAQTCGFAQNSAQLRSFAQKRAQLSGPLKKALKRGEELLKRGKQAQLREPLKKVPERNLAKKQEALPLRPKAFNFENVIEESPQEVVVSHIFERQKSGRQVGRERLLELLNLDCSCASVCKSLASHSNLLRQLDDAVLLEQAHHLRRQSLFAHQFRPLLA